MNYKHLGRFSWVVGFLGFLGLLGLNHSPAFYLSLCFLWWISVLLVV
ncbi:hypothetical protein [Lactiplantibacillus plantarum]